MEVDKSCNSAADKVAAVKAELQAASDTAPLQQSSEQQQLNQESCGQNYVQPPYIQSVYDQQTIVAKNHIVAGLLAIFLGWLGVHKFYLGYNTPGFIMLSVSVVGGILTLSLALWVIWVIAIIEGIMYLIKPQADFDQLYVKHKREWF